MLESFLNKVGGLKACNFIKKRLQHRFFPVNIAKLFRAPIFREHLQWLHLDLRPSHSTQSSTIAFSFMFLSDSANGNLSEFLLPTKYNNTQSS